MWLSRYYTKTLMKKSCLTFAALLLFVAASFSQDVIRLQSCKDDLISKQVDSLKTLYGKDGFSLLKEASITMESEFEMPVIVPLTQGTWYQFVFIGDYTSRLYEVRMLAKKMGRCRWKHYFLFLYSKVLRISYDEACAGQQNKKEESLRLRNALQENG